LVTTAGSQTKVRILESRKIVAIGWIVSLVGTALWLYGYFAMGRPPLIDWQAHTPWWIADALPDFESEIGMTLCFVGTALIYWPTKH
jgi:uncharacterized membrane protein YGL010W